ncbi:hypothetical protein, partial [Chryseobacterium sp. HMWF001]
SKYIELEISKDNISFPNEILYALDIVFFRKNVTFSKGVLKKYSKFTEDNILDETYELVKKNIENVTVNVDNGHMNP